MGKKKKIDWEPLELNDSIFALTTCAPDSVGSAGVRCNVDGSLEKQDISSPSVSRTLGEKDTDDEIGVVDKVSTKIPDSKSTTNTKATYVSLFKDNRNNSHGMKLEVQASEDDEVSFEEDEVDDVNRVWGYCLIGYIAARFPGKSALLKLCESWKVKFQFHIHTSGWLVFHFENQQDRDLVLNGGPYFVFGCPLLLKVMPQCFEFDDEDISILPVWINLPSLPLELWNAKALSKIVSKVGRPISTDRLTQTKERISYARVLVEVDAAKELVRSVHLKLPNGKKREQEVLFEFEPKFCASCKVFGHTSSICSQPKPQQDNELKNPDPPPPKCGRLCAY